LIHLESSKELHSIREKFVYIFFFFFCKSLSVPDLYHPFLKDILCVEIHNYGLIISSNPSTELCKDCTGSRNKCCGGSAIQHPLATAALHMSENMCNLLSTIMFNIIYSMGSSLGNSKKNVISFFKNVTWKS
jgi:hypothetical protein